MITAAHQSLFTYVGHYLLARLLYDQLLRPVLRGGAAAWFAAVACVVFAAWLVRGA